MGVGMGGKGADFLGLSEAPHQPLPRRYSVEGFIDKNRDHLFQDFKRLLYNRCVGWSWRRSPRASSWKGLQTPRSDTNRVGCQPEV